MDALRSHADWSPLVSQFESNHMKLTHLGNICAYAGYDPLLALLQCLGCKVRERIRR